MALPGEVWFAATAGAVFLALSAARPRTAAWLGLITGLLWLATLLLLRWMQAHQDMEKIDCIIGIPLWWLLVLLSPQLIPATGVAALLSFLACPSPESLAAPWWLKGLYHLALCALATASLGVWRAATWLSLHG